LDARSQTGICEGARASRRIDRAVCRQTGWLDLAKAFSVPMESERRLYFFI
jgi:hypothetical protein